jgi:hypothetical protein
MRQDFVYNNACVIPDINIFDTHSGYLLLNANEKSNQDTTRTWQTSAIIIRRNAFAIDASTPTMSNSTDRLERR